MIKIVFILVAIILFSIYIFLGCRIRKSHQILAKLKQQNNNYQQNNEKLQVQLNTLKTQKEKEQEKINFLLNEMSSVAEMQRQTATNALECYVDSLDMAYKNAEIEYEQNIKMLNQSYDNMQTKKIQEMTELQKELNSIKATRDAAIAALVKEKEIQEKLSFYCLNPNNSDISDVQALERIKPQLNNPRVLSMLIWQTFFQKPMTSLCNNVLGADVVCGIYKITNQETQEAYIGQSVDVSKRWKDHIKCGLGIDTPAGNKLYKAMQEYGVWKFSWELLEECPKDELNAKEKFYISLYKTYEYGYNSNTGISK